MSAAIATIGSATNQVSLIALGIANGAADPINPAVGEIWGSTAFKANLAVLKTAELMTGAGLNLKV